LDVLANNETRLDPTISDGLVSIEGYDMLRADRDRNGGGVCMYIRCHVSYENRPGLVPSDLQTKLYILSPCKPTKNLLQSFIVSSIYGPPCSPSEVFTKIERLIKSIDDDNKELYILGDLNCNMLEPSLSTTKSLQEILEHISAYTIN
jgi:hypothetical protein